ncbi:hypothetical protein [Halpernia sp.]|uniref:hypothetical protein n=1 Tax=Halpernia sp. TaxID=2782209 RepID=UPI003A8D1C87
MKIVKSTITLILFFVFIFNINSCNREEIPNQNTELNHNVLKQNFENKLKNDKSFIDFTKSYLKSTSIISKIEITSKIAQKSQKSNLSKTSEDIAIENDAVYDTTTYLFLFANSNKEFDLLTDQEKQEVVNTVLINAKNTVDLALQKNPHPTFGPNTLEGTFIDFKDDLDDFNNDPQYQNESKITWGEVGGCAILAVGTYLGSNYSVIRDLFGLLNGESLTFNLVKDAVKLVFPELKAAETIFNFASCLTYAYFF